MAPATLPPGLAAPAALAALEEERPTQASRVRAFEADLGARTARLEALDVQTCPVFLTYPADAGLDELSDRIASSAPDIDFTSPDGVQHTSWTLVSQWDTQFIESRFDSIPNRWR